MVICLTCHHEYEGHLKLCPVCLKRISSPKRKHWAKNRLHKHKYVSKKRGLKGRAEVNRTRQQRDKWDGWVGLDPDEVMLWSGETYAELWEQVAQVGYEENVRDRCVSILNGALADVRADHLRALRDEGKQATCLTLLRKIQRHLANVLRKNGVVWQETNRKFSRVNWMHDSDDRVLAHYQNLCKKALRIRASHLQNIQKTQTREVCIAALLKAMAICNNTLQEMGFDESEAGRSVL